jgi:subtilase family serine protease
MLLSKPRAIVLVLVAAAALGASLSTVVWSHTATRSPSANAAVVVGQAHRIGDLSRGTIRFALDLRLQERKLSAYLRHVQVGGSGLTASEFGARFGPSNADVAALRVLLRRLGITVTHLYPQRTAMLVSSSVSRVDQVFSLRLGRYALPGGRQYFAPDGQPRIPAALSPYIAAVGDLSNQPIPAGDIPSSGLTPAVVAKAYDIAALWNAGIRGQGQTIAVASAAGAINPADIQAFAQRAGVQSPQITIRPIDGGSKYTARVGSDPEVDLDLQVVLGVAPDANIIDYQGSDGSTSGQLSLGHSLADIYNRVEQDGQAKIVTTSYGLCEALLTPGDQQLMDSALKALEASGVTVFIATGDTGAFACLQAAQIQPASTLTGQFTALGIQSPSSSPYAVSVGGTRLEVRADNSYLFESAWSDPLARQGAGGGVSRSEPRPSWQQGPGVIRSGTNPAGARQTPDVAGPADPSSGYLVCSTPAGASGPSCSGGSGGTSAAAPFWAASMLLVQQYAASHGARALAHCFAGPILYDLAAKPQPVPAFHQITLGNNGFYAAAPGWNYASGLGTPDVFNLAQDYAAMLRSRSSRSCPF